MNVYMLLDRSGSMNDNGLIKEAIGSINAYAERLPHNTKIRLAIFDMANNEFDYQVIRNCKTDDWKNINLEEVTPRGTTPLYDASARMMQTALDDNPDRAIFVVMTDGIENASQKYNKHEVKTLVEKFKSKAWEVIFLGANFDKVGDVAKDYGLGADKWLNSTQRNLRETMFSLAQSSADYATRGIVMGFSEQDKIKAGSDENSSEKGKASDPAAAA